MEFDGESKRELGLVDFSLSIVQLGSDKLGSLAHWGGGELARLPGMQFAIYCLWESLKLHPLITAYAPKTSYTGKLSTDIN